MDTEIRPGFNAMAETLKQADTRRLFDAMDTLRRINFGTNEVPIPQLIVVGDQSSGKSSVLESISEISLPINSGISTRFPIEVVLRRSPERRLGMRIIPGRIQANDPVAIARMEQFGKDNSSLDDSIDLSSKINAAESIGVPTDGTVNNNSRIRFSDDVLQITHHGLNLVDLTLIDLPGVFGSNFGNQQTNEDLERVQQITKQYAQDPRSIVLLVCSGDNDYAANTTPTVISDAKERTMGILTKLDRDGNAKKALDLLNARKETVCELGWHFLANRTDEERRRDPSFQTRDEKEKKMLENNPDLPARMCGIEQLRIRLRDHVLQLTKDRLPEITEDVKKAVERRRAELDSLPSARPTEWSQRYYLIDQATKFVKLAEASTYPNTWAMPDFFGDYDRGGLRDDDGCDLETVMKRKLQATVRELNCLFSAAIWTHGRSTIIHGYDEERHVDDDDEVEKILPASTRDQYFSLEKPKPIKMRDYEREIAQRHREWLGKSPRSEVSPDFYFTVLRKATSRWKTIAKTHLNVVWQAAVDFIDKALRHNMPTEVRLAVRETIIDPRLDTLRRTAEERLEELIRCQQMESQVFFDAYPHHISVGGTNPMTGDSLLWWIQSAVRNLRSLNNNHINEVLDMLSSGNIAGLREYYNKSEEKQFIPTMLEQLLGTSLPQPLLEVVKLALNNLEGEPESLVVSPELEAARRVIDQVERYYKVSLASGVRF